MKIDYQELFLAKCRENKELREEISILEKILSVSLPLLEKYDAED